MSTVLLLDGHVYGVSLYGETCCLSAEDGRRIWTTLEPTSAWIELDLRDRKPRCTA